jgi:hypothetical protein
MTRALAVLTLSGVLILGVAAWGQPADDRLVVYAEFRPAEDSDWSAWRASIFDDRRLEFTFPEAMGQPSPRRLESAQLQRFLGRIERSNFDKLDASYDLTSDAGTGDRLTLQVRTGEGLHEVSLTVPAYATGLAKTISDRDDRGDVEEFLSIWAELLRYVRTPNRDQTRKLYRP